MVSPGPTSVAFSDDVTDATRDTIEKRVAEDQHTPQGDEEVDGSESEAPQAMIRFPSPDDGSVVDDTRSNSSSSPSRASSISPNEYVYPDLPDGKLPNLGWLRGMQGQLEDEKGELQYEVAVLSGKVSYLVAQTTLAQMDLEDEIKATNAAIERLKKIVDPKWVELALEIADDAIESGVLDDVEDFLDPVDEGDAEKGESSAGRNGGGGNDEDDDVAPDGGKGHNNEGPAHNDENEEDVGSSEEEEEKPVLSQPFKSATATMKGKEKRMYDDSEDDEYEVAQSISVQQPSKRSRLSGGSNHSQDADSEASMSDEEAPVEIASRARDEETMYGGSPRPLTVVPPTGGTMVPRNESAGPLNSARETRLLSGRSPARVKSMPSSLAKNSESETPRRAPKPLTRHFERILETVGSDGEPIPYVVDTRIEVPVQPLRTNRRGRARKSYFDYE